VYLAASKNKQQVYLTGHPEYDASTLSEEYFRDIAAGGKVSIPDNYFTDDDPEKEAANMWRSHGSLLYTNWLNYYVYQITPYQLDANHIKAIHPGKSRV
jgi:homoserine O-succinyltransferase